MNRRQHLELHGLPEKLYARLWLRKKRRANIRSGKTWNGQTRNRQLRPDLAKLSRNARHAVTNHERRTRLGLTTFGVALAPKQAAAAIARITKRPFITNEVEIARLRVRLARYERLGLMDAEIERLHFLCEQALRRLLLSEREVA